MIVMVIDIVKVVFSLATWTLCAISEKYKALYIFKVFDTYRGKGQCTYDVSA